MSCAIKTAPTY